MDRTGWSRRDFLKRGSLAAGLVVAPGFLAACQRTDTSGGGDSALEQLRSQGSITVGIAGEEPYAYNDGGELTGMEPEIHKRIWPSLGIDTVEAQQVGFDGLIPGLNAQRFNVVAAGMFVLPERCAEAAFSDLIYCAPNAFLVPEGNPDDITDFQSVADAGIKLAVLGAAVEGGYAIESGVSESDVVEVPTQRDGLLQLEQGRVGAFGLTTISLRNILASEPNTSVELTEPFTPVVDGEEQLGCGAAVFRQQDDELRQAFNEELANLRESGDLQDIIKPFGFGPETAPPDGVTTEQLCQA